MHQNIIIAQYIPIVKRVILMRYFYWVINRVLSVILNLLSFYKILFI